MVDITQKPYFQHRDAISCLLNPLQSHVEIQFLGFRRFFKNHERFIITNYKDLFVDIYTISELYRYGLFERTPSELSSAFHMWDHLPYSPPEIYEYKLKEAGHAHGLTIIQQHGDYCDSFVFTTHPKNNQINNFYLNEKDLFGFFIQEFYEKFSPILKDLTHQTFVVPPGESLSSMPSHILTLRQRECAEHLVRGLTTKEIARDLSVSPRTVEFHLNHLKSKFNARNRAHLCQIIRPYI